MDIFTLVIVIVALLLGISVINWLGKTFSGKPRTSSRGDSGDGAHPVALDRHSHSGGNDGDDGD